MQKIKRKISDFNRFMSILKSIRDIELIEHSDCFVVKARDGVVEYTYCPKKDEEFEINLYLFSEPIIDYSNVYVHKKKGGFYKLVEIRKDLLSQYEGEWYPTVIYTKLRNKDKSFARTDKEFFEKFTKWIS